MENVDSARQPQALAPGETAWEVEHYHAAILAELTAAGLALYHSDPEPDMPLVGCRHCEAKFPTHQQRALHEFRIHQILAEERFMVQSTVCSGCLKDFHTTYRVTQHRRYRPNRCWSRLNGVKVPDTPANIGLPDHLRDVPRLPAVRRHHGPLRPTPHQREHLRVRREISALYAEGEPDFAWWDPNDSPELRRQCCDEFAQCLHRWAGSPEPTEVEFHNHFFQLFATMPIPEFQAARIFIFWIEHEFQDIHCIIDIDL